MSGGFIKTCFTWWEMMFDCVCIQEKLRFHIKQGHQLWQVVSFNKNKNLLKYKIARYFTELIYSTVHCTWVENSDQGYAITMISLNFSKFKQTYIKHELSA